MQSIQCHWYRPGLLPDCQSPESQLLSFPIRQCLHWSVWFLCYEVLHCQWSGKMRSNQWNTQKQQYLYSEVRSCITCNSSDQCAAGTNQIVVSPAVIASTTGNNAESQARSRLHETPPFVCYRLWRAASYMRIPDAMAAFRDSTFPHIGICIRQSALSAASSVSPFPHCQSGKQFLLCRFLIIRVLTMQMRHRMCGYFCLSPVLNDTTLSTYRKGIL